MSRRAKTAWPRFPVASAEARAAIDEALDYAAAIGAGAVHVMAGVTDAADARDTFVANLRYACDRAGPDRIILIEPLNRFDAPGYFLNTTAQARRHHRPQSAAPNLRLMFDCYHVGRTEGDVIARLHALCPSSAISSSPPSPTAARPITAKSIT